MVKDDFSESIRFITKERTDTMKMLLLAALAHFFVRSIAAGLLTGKLRSGRLSYVLAAIGVCILPAEAVFLFPSGALIRYAVTVAVFCGMQAAISLFSILRYP